MRNKVLLPLLIIASLCLPGCGSTRPIGTLAFTDSLPDTGDEIYTILSDGSNQSKVTDHSFERNIESFSISPDGKQIVYQVYFRGVMPGPYEEIMLISMDGTGETRLTDNEFTDQNPSWSPDGRRILFNSWRDKTSREFEILSHIYVMNVDGSGLTQLTPDANSKDWDAKWSPDGSQIVFVSDRDGVNAIYLMDADGSNPRRLSQGKGILPAWSPDGSRIAYMNGFMNDYELHVVNKDGSNALTLSEHLEELQFSWSPDGSQIVGVKDREISVIRTDGSGEKQLTDNTVRDVSPVWSPDGKLIAFVSVVDNVQADIFIMDPNGDHLTRLTDDAWYEIHLVWVPSAAVTIVP